MFKNRVYGFQQPVYAAGCAQKKSAEERPLANKYEASILIQYRSHSCRAETHSLPISQVAFVSAM